MGDQMSRSSSLTRLLGVLAFLIAISLVTPSAAQAHAGSLSGRGTVITSPSPEQRQKASEAVASAEGADPVGFEKRMTMLRSSTALRDYLGSVPGFDANEQMSFAAAEMPTDALEALILLTDRGSIKIQATKGSDGKFRASIEIPEKSSSAVHSGGGIGR